MPRPKIAIFTLTRDRLEYTRRTLRSMRESRPGMAYDHWFFDNGSTDGTINVLRQLRDSGRIYALELFGHNKGLHVSMNVAHKTLLDAGYRYIMKVDNDVEFKTKHWLRKLVRAQKVLAPGSVVSPKVEGLDYPPEPFARRNIEGFNVHFLDIIGGITRLMPRESIEKLRFNERMPLGWGGDFTFANHCERNIIPMAYITDIRVRHMDSTQGQERLNPEYMERKKYESYIPYGL